MKHFTVLIFGILLSALVAADECTVDLNYNIKVSSTALTVSGKSETIYEIGQGGLLSVKGASVALNEGQLALAEEYAGEVAVLVPQWITLVSSALTVAEQALNVAFTALFGEDSEAVSRSTVALANARERFENSSSVENGVYSISVTAFDSVGGAFDEEFDEEIEDAVMASLGAVFLEVGKTLLSSEADFDDSLANFGSRMDHMGEELEAMGAGLEGAAKELCQGMRRVQKLEQRVMEEIPELADYQLFGS